MQGLVGALRASTVVCAPDLEACLLPPELPTAYSMYRWTVPSIPTRAEPSERSRQSTCSTKEPRQNVDQGGAKAAPGMMKRWWLSNVKL
jgi:hypothetical protein